VSEITGILHAPRLPEAGVPVRLQFLGELLRIEGAGTQDVMAEALEISVTGFNDDTLLLAWQKEDGTHAVTVADAAAQRALVADAPESIARKLRRGRNAVRYHRGKWNAVIGALVACVLLVLLVWWQSEAITAWIAGRVSQETEIAIGEHALAQIETENELTQEGLAAKTVAEIGGRLTAGSRYKYRWYVSNDKEVNAFALPGGIVVVNAGLIAKAGSADELAGVLAHEVQHVELRHTLQQMIHAAGWAAVLAVVLGDVSAITAIVVHQLGNLRNSRKLEAQADAEGMKALARAGIPLDGMSGMFKRLQSEESRLGDRTPGLLSSHPATEERIAELERLAKTLQCKCRALIYDWPAVQNAATAVTN
jgi:Zn-dependent protease with chaperone function